MPQFNLFTVTCPASTGNATHAHGLTFAPKAFIFFGANLNGDDVSGANWEHTYGFAVAHTRPSRLGSVVPGGECVAATALDALDVQDTYAHKTVQGPSGKFCINISAESAIVMRAAYVNADETNLTLNWTTVNDGFDVFCLAIGGKGVQATTGQLRSRNGIGKHVVRGIGKFGFKPDTILFIAANGVVAASAINGFHIGIGAANEAKEQFGLSFAVRAGQDFSGVAESHDHDRIMFHQQSAGTQEEISFTSMNDDGFSIYWNKRPTQGKGISYLALKGVGSKIKVYDQPTSTGNDDILLSGLKPQCLILSSINHTALGNSFTTIDGRLSYGIATSPTNRRCIFGGEEDNVNTTITSQDHDSGAIIKMMTQAGATPTVDAEADLVSFEHGKATLNWSVVDASARKISVLALGAPLKTEFLPSPISILTNPIYQQLSYRFRYDDSPDI